MEASELRNTFINYFVERQHTLVPSASLIANDPSLLFTVAGMVPFKPYFTGEEPAPYRRAVSIQKCFRAPDIDVIGTDQRHLTFFEMMGNFSFGDYFKEGAIRYAWELITEGFGLDPERLWVTVHRSDDEAADIWRDTISLPAERIQRLDEDNFWAMGDTGPCGPDSEIFIDKGASFGDPGGPASGGEDRFVELWNLVFMQFEKSVGSTMVELPNKNIDTGSGFERVLSIVNGVDSVFDTDLFAPLLEVVSQSVGRSYGQDEKTDVSIRRIAEHGRAMTMLVADGVLPSNEGRGYVLRRIIRRAVLAARRAGAEGALSNSIVEATIEKMGFAYPVLVKDRDLIIEVLEREEAAFARTLSSGLKQFSEVTQDYYADLRDLILEKASKDKMNRIEARVREQILRETRDLNSAQLMPSIDLEGPLSPPVAVDPEWAELSKDLEEIEFKPASELSLELLRKVAKSMKIKLRPLSGEEAFKLHDTYGFPIELTTELASESGLQVDSAKFLKAMTAQRERARASAKTLRVADDAQYRELMDRHGASEFVGRDLSRYSVETTVLAVLAGESGESELFLEATPFYAESGGQVGDTGVVVTETGRFEVLDTQNVAGGLFAHRGRLSGDVVAGQAAVATIEPERREATRRNHTATHLLHAGLRSVLGDHVRQQGSFVGPDRLRFDFSHGAGVTPEETREILTMVNTDVVLNEHVDTIQTTKAEAETMGAVAFFGDKYGDRVRVVRAGRHSLEFCGGTHVDRLGDIGQIQVVAESSIGANTRRIEAVSGLGAHRRSYEMERTIDSVAALLKTSREDVVPALERLFERQRDVDKEIAALRQSQLAQFAHELDARTEGDVVVARVDGFSGDQLRTLAQDLQRRGRRAVVLVGEHEAKVAIAVATDESLDAVSTVKSLAAHVGGGGGGSARVALAGGRDAGGIDALLVAAKAL